MIDDGYSAHVVIDRVIDILCECRTTCSDDYGASGNICYAEVYLACVVAFVATGQDEFVVLGNLLRYSFCAVIEFAEAVFVGQNGVVNPFRQVFAEGFCNREDDASLADSIAFHEVELTIGMRIVLCVEAVQVEGSQQYGALELLFWQITEIDTS